MLRTDAGGLDGHLDQMVPRYVTYPTAASFDPKIAGRQHDAWLETLPEGARLEVSLHIPFCPQVCWYCACRTQAVRDRTLVDGYLDALIAEIDRTGRRLPAGAEVVRVSWRGGSPSRLAPDQIDRLAEALAGVLPLAPGREVIVEVEPAGTTDEQHAALCRAGMTRAVVGVQDFDPVVQEAIGRVVSHAEVRRTCAALREAGVAIVVDQLFGLARQGLVQLAATVGGVIELRPDRISLTGYVHVPSWAKRQRMIRPEDLPDVRARRAQFETAARRYEAAGYRMLGIDHFVLPGDPLLADASRGALRRSGGGYVAGEVAAHLGFGAAAISSFRQGYVQNVPHTGAYCRAAQTGPAAERGAALGLEDRVRARAIGMVLCGFCVDLGAIRQEFGDFASVLEEGCREALRRYAGFLSREGEVLRVTRDAPIVARLVARIFDARSEVSRGFGPVV